jgi:hypothetical protein
MFLPVIILAVVVFGYLLWFDTYCELKDLRRDVKKAIEDIEKAMPKATHSVKTEVLGILRRIKC